MAERYKELEIRKNPQENLFSFLLIFEKYSILKFHTMDNRTKILRILTASLILALTMFL